MDVRCIVWLPRVFQGNDLLHDCDDLSSELYDALEYLPCPSIDCMSERPFHAQQVHSHAYLYISKQPC